MRTRLFWLLIAPLMFGAAAPAGAESPIAEARRAARQAYRRAVAEAREFYQGRRGPEQTEGFSRRVRLGPGGRVSVSNISGSITVTTAAGDEVVIDAVKRGRGDRRDLDRARIIVNDRPGRVEVRTEHSPSWRNDNVAVDYTVVVPAGVSLDVYSVSGRINVDGVKGTIRLGTVSGNIASSNAPKVEYVRTVSGEVSLAGVSQDENLAVSTVSGNVDLTGIKARVVDLNTVSGELRLRDAACARLQAKSVSGGLEYSGTLARNGRYDANSHSGSLRFALADSTGFELSANTFSGAVRSDFQMTIGGDRNRDIRTRRGPGRGGMQATFGDGSASLNLHTFSGDIAIVKR